MHAVYRLSCDPVAGLYLAPPTDRGHRGGMEMHQVRYFLAVAETLNFTRAAQHCNVSQPALTRAIQQDVAPFRGVHPSVSC